MTSSTILMEHHTPVEISLPRTRGTFNISKLSESPPASRESASASEASTVNSQILYMKDNSPVRRNALSRKNNTSVPDLLVDDIYTAKPVGEGERQWSIVDQEVFEWQLARQTGQPSWLTRRLPRPWHKKDQMTSQKRSMPTSEESWLLPLHSKTHEASESSPINDRQQDDLARLAAMQLLGSCYTLPAELPYTQDQPLPAANGDDIPLPDPRLISSLRMHSQYNYSPCFGHQARNASLAHVWPSHLDGADNSAMTTKENSQYAEEGGEYKAASQSENITDGSIHSSSPGKYAKDDTKQRRHTFSFPSLHASSKLLAKTGKADRQSAGSNEIADLCNLLAQSGAESPKTEHVGKPIAARLASQSCSGIRSEPYDFLFNPIKDQVLQRWKSFAGRVGRVRSQRLSLVAAEDAPSRLPTSVLSESGKARRRQSQQESEIEGIMEDFPLVTTPTDMNFLPIISDRDTIYSSGSEDETPRSQLADPLAAAAELVNALTDGRHGAEGSAAHSTKKSPRIMHNRSPNPKSASEERSSRTISRSSSFRPHSPPPARSPSQRRYASRTRRKSLLSEVFSLDDVEKQADEESSALILTATQLPLSIEEVKTPSPIRDAVGWLDLPPAAIMDKETFTTTKGESKQHRPAVGRISTSGTEVYLPV